MDNRPSIDEYPRGSMVKSHSMSNEINVSEAELPDFGNPPLDEVVFGIQFGVPSTYQHIHALDVYSLYRDSYPVIQEMPPLPPAFETFGPQSFIDQNPFFFQAAGQRCRYWFLSSDHTELLQFQEDRLLHNWRKVGDRSNSYPRYENMIRKYRDEIYSLQSYFRGSSGEEVVVNQCEVSYINNITDEKKGSLIADQWLKFSGFDDVQPEDFKIGFREIIKGSHGQPSGRFICEAGSALRPDGHSMIGLTLTVRGVPEAPTIESALEFIARGRELIVRRFASLTTDSAHKKWERVR